MPNYAKASFLDDFELPEITHEALKQQIIKVGRQQSVARKKSFKNMPLSEQLKIVTEGIYKILGRYKGFIKVIRNYDDYMQYINRAIKVDYLSLDTETNNSVDPLTCKIMGLCLYVPNAKPAYVPLNHCVPGTEELLDNQITLTQAQEGMQLIKDANTKIVYHNSAFDIRVVANTLNVRHTAWWDTMIAAQLLNENEKAKLKLLYPKYVDPTIDDYNIEEVFMGLPYAWINPEIFALYAAIDAYDTYKLQKYQQTLFESDDLKKMYKLFREIEMPVTSVVAQMEDDGVTLDLDLLSKLNAVYKSKQAEAYEKLQEILEPYRASIEYYQSIGKLDTPINFDSPQQLPIVLYDILKTPMIDNSRSTDKATLNALETPFTKTMLTYRHYTKLINAFTEPLPKWISSTDGKLHAGFHQIGSEENNVRTGRFSSTRPNLQQIPSKELTFRLMFKASTDYKDIEIKDIMQLDIASEVLTEQGWKYVNDLQIGDKICVNADTYNEISFLEKHEDIMYVSVKREGDVNVK